jgi:starch phosphorylase
MHDKQHPFVIAYFSMEICLAEGIPTYSGGLGVLAGDTLRSAADLELPMLGITLLHRKGYFGQRLDPQGNQSEVPVSWNPESFMEKLDTTLVVEIEGREVKVAVWRYSIAGTSGGEVAVYLLDTDVHGNSEFDRSLTDHLYGGDARYRLCQEVLLGIGGVDLVERIVDDDGRGVLHHINEGHASLLTLRLLERRLHDSRRSAWETDESDLDAVRRQVVFTTHTPVPAGHDRFPVDLTSHVLGETRTRLLEQVLNGSLDELNMTGLALRLSRYVNAVSMRHGEVSREMFGDVNVDSITNGVHAGTWVCAPVARLFDRYVERWRHDARYLRMALGIPLYDLLAAHAECKAALMREVTERTRVKLDADAFTIGFARRATPYKRADLVFSDLAWLRTMVKKHGALQFVFAGKAHPHDEPGKELIRRIFRAAAELDGDVRIVYLEGYDMKLGKLLTSGVDLWLNNPMRPLEASGTSGMKAALNGVPSLSVLDGWWIEGHVEGATGWSIGDDPSTDIDPSADVYELYFKLDKVILPLYYGARQDWARVMRNAIAINGSYFNTERMLMQYVRNAYTTEGTWKTASSGR